MEGKRRTAVPASSPVGEMNKVEFQLQSSKQGSWVLQLEVQPALYGQQFILSL